MDMLPPPDPLAEHLTISETIGVDGESNSFALTVVYDPHALRRSIFIRVRGYAVNPDSRAVRQFCGLLQNSFRPGTSFPYYASMEARILLAITFRIARPKSHFVNNNRTNRLKDKYAATTPKEWMNTTWWNSSWMQQMASSIMMTSKSPTFLLTRCTTKILHLLLDQLLLLLM